MGLNGAAELRGGAEGGRGKRGFGSALLGSLLLHCTFGGVVCAVAPRLPAVPAPLVVDLTALSLPTAEREMRAAAPAGQPRQRKGQRRPRPAAPPAQPLPAPVPMPVVSPPVPVPAAPPTPAPAAVPPAVVAVAGGSPATTGVVAGAGGSTASGGNGTAAGGHDAGGSAAVSTTTLQQRYLREHFAYIRELIGRELRYPRRALRMGWSGRVAVTFLVLVDGSVTELRVARSSGCPLLDGDALATVRRAAPFPRPPVSARLLIPVDYVLE